MIAVLVGLVLGCRPLDLGPRCASHAECSDGEGCLVGRCLPASCTGNDACAFEERCRELTCVPGCDGPSDCPAGETCTPDHVCAPEQCSVTALDCPAGHVCEDGTCVEREGICEPCESACDGGSVCIGLDDGAPRHCLPRCRFPSDCPAAFACLPVEGTGLSVCTADCDWLQAEGYL